MKMTGTVTLGCGSMSRYVIPNFIIQLDLTTELLSVTFSFMAERAHATCYNNDKATSLSVCFYLHRLNLF
jgi:hypothetical protein